MPREKGKFGVPSLGTALNPMPCGPRALGNVAAMQEEARRAEVCLLAWVLWPPILLSHRYTGCAHEHSQVSGCWGQNACTGVLALPLVHHDLVRFLCASVYLSVKEGLGSQHLPHRCTVTPTHSKCSA